MHRLAGTVLAAHCVAGFCSRFALSGTCCRPCSSLLLSRRRGGGVTDEGSCRLAGSAGEQRRTARAPATQLLDFGVKARAGRAGTGASLSSLRSSCALCRLGAEEDLCRAPSPPGRRADDGDAALFGDGNGSCMRQPPWRGVLASALVCARVAWTAAVSPASQPAAIGSSSVCVDGDTCFQWGSFQAFPAGTTLRLRGLRR